MMTYKNEHVFMTDKKERREYIDKYRQAMYAVGTCMIY